MRCLAVAWGDCPARLDSMDVVAHRRHPREQVWFQAGCHTVRGSSCPVFALGVGSRLRHHGFDAPPAGMGWVCSHANEPHHRLRCDRTSLVSYSLSMLVALVGDPLKGILLDRKGSGAVHRECMVDPRADKPGSGSDWGSRDVRP
jgi:hypothetical protein